jgi:predicted MFS family arabinose efflux permease
MIGMAVAQAMSPLCVEQTTGAHLDQLLAGQALAILACTVATGWYFQSQPALPPSAAEAARQQPTTTSLGITTNEALKRDVWKLATDPQYQLLLVAFGLEYGVNNAVLTLLQPWIASSGYEGDAIAGLCGSLAIVGGILGNLIAAPLLDASKNYNQAIRWSFIVAFLVALATVAILQYEAPVWLLATIFFTVGMSQLPLLTIVLDAAAAHSYPIPEELSSAGLQLVGQYLGVAMVDVMGCLISANKDGRKGFAAPVNMSFLIFLGLSAGIGICYHGDDPRNSANAAAASSTANQEDATADVELADDEER